jgi:uncharacterized protein
MCEVQRRPDLLRQIQQKEIFFMQSSEDAMGRKMNPVSKSGKPAEAYRERSYRQLVRSSLTAMRVVVQETDLCVYADKPLSEEARDAAMLHRGYLENYIRRHPDFVRALSPWPEDPLAPAVVCEMIKAGRSAGVGPMAAVAGAIAEHVGIDLLARTKHVIVENGGDIFIQTHGPLTIGVFAGQSPLSLKIGIRLETDGTPLAVCTSSGSVGHSLSLGRADATCIISRSCPLADAVATALGNRIQKPADIQGAIDWAKGIEGVRGILVISGEALGGWGDLKVVGV